MSELEIMKLHSEKFDNTGYAKLEVSKKGNFIITEVNQNIKYTFVYDATGALIHEAVQEVKIFVPEGPTVLKWIAKYTNSTILFESECEVMITSSNYPAPQAMRYRTLKGCHSGWLMGLSNWKIDTWHFPVAECVKANEYEIKQYLQLKNKSK